MDKIHQKYLFKECCPKAKSAANLWSKWNTAAKMQPKPRTFKNNYGWFPDAKQTCMGGEVQAEEKNRSDSFSTPHDHAYLNFGL